jgi:hypothetical protein
MIMAQDNREFISKEKVQRHLLEENKRDIKLSATAGCVIVLLMALITSGVYALAPKTWLLWGLCMLLTVFLFYSFFIKGVIGMLCNRRRILQGEFHIEQDYARQIDDDEPTAWDFLFIFTDWLWIPFVGKMVRCIHFSGKRRFAASDRTRQHATPGDPFYLAVLNNRKKEIAYVYNAKYYRLKEL